MPDGVTTVAAPAADTVASTSVTPPDFDQEVLAAWPTASAIAPEELARRFPKRGFVQGWMLPGASLGLPESLVLAIDADPTWSLPKVGIYMQPALCVMPHVEGDGIFCLTPSTAAASVPVGIGHARQLVQEAVDAYRQGSSGANREDFLKEFGTYWELGEPVSEHGELWLAEMGNTQAVFVASDGATFYATDSQERLAAWLESRGVKQQKVRSAVYIRLAQPLYPQDYPKTTADLVSLAAASGADASTLLARAVKVKQRLTVLLGFENRGTVIVGAVHTDIENRFRDHRGQGQQFIAAAGRRSISDTHLLNRLAQARFPTIRVSVTRADSRYLNLRTAGAVPEALRRARIGIIGCGALGGAIAMRLAQSGARYLTLIDGDILKIENVGRHELGSAYIGRYKSEAMRDEIKGRYCDYKVKSIAATWQKAYKDTPGILEQCDVLIAATGDWLSNAHLNAVAVELKIPVIYCWLERFALAGHGLLAMPDSACLQCVSNEFGDFDHQVSILGGELPTDPSCGGQYQPFAAYASSQAASMMVKLVLDTIEERVQTSQLRTWVAPYDEFDRVDAQINDNWHNALVVEGGFERTFRRQVHPHSACAAPHNR
jgi:molybdopterin/thiamine biosynthesis adenylyltransferase